MGAATVFVDLVDGLSSGASSKFRAFRPDLISWDNLPYNVDVLDANTVAEAGVTGNPGDNDGTPDITEGTEDYAFIEPEATEGLQVAYNQRTSH